MGAMFAAPDAFGEPTLWLHNGDADPTAIIRLSDLAPAAHHLWNDIVARVVGAS